MRTVLFLPIGASDRTAQLHRVETDLPFYPRPRDCLSIGEHELVVSSSMYVLKSAMAFVWFKRVLGPPSTYTDDGWAAP